MSLEAFWCACGDEGAVSAWCCFDNEEVGSNTKQGAITTFLPDVLTRGVGRQRRGLPPRAGEVDAGELR
ncbi:MAG: hypothetical protein ACLT98_09810 [Eggerthellaceae bacterium]